MKCRLKGRPEMPVWFLTIRWRSFFTRAAKAAPSLADGGDDKKRRRERNQLIKEREQNQKSSGWSTNFLTG